MRPGRKNRTSKTLGIVLVVGVIAAGTYAFTNSNTFAGTNNAGDGGQATSGYEVASLDYNEDALNPAVLDSVDFQLDGAADRVKVQLSQNAGDDTWFACTADASPLGVLGLATGSTAWICNTSDYAAADVTNFRVLAYEDANSAI